MHRIQKQVKAKRMATGTPPYFSVITPSFNQGAYIGRCLESVTAQQDASVEHLVFDNCSSDQTAKVVGRFPGVGFVSRPDRGQSDAVNQGLRAARGEVVCWLNSDDAYPVGTFTRLRGAFSDPAVEVVFGDVEQVAYDGREPRRVAARFAHRDDLIRWWRRDVSLHQPAVFFRRQLLDKIGLLREDLHYAMDYDYWWRMSEVARFHYVPEVLAIQHRQPESKTIRAWGEVYREREVIFSPHYGRVDGGDRAALMGEKRRMMADRLLVEAYATLSSPRLAIGLLWGSFRESPVSLLNFRWLGLVRRILFARDRAGG